MISTGVISRTVAYAIITGLLAGVYAGLVLLATQVLRVHTPVAVAAATLAAAALFNPVRRRVQKAVDRRFNRARYDADQTVAAFAAHDASVNPHSTAPFDPDLVTVRMDQIGGAKFTEPLLPVAEIRSSATSAKRMVSLMACALP
jgi:hypothetical protein